MIRFLMHWFAMKFVSIVFQISCIVCAYYEQAWFYVL